MKHIFLLTYFSIFFSQNLFLQDYQVAGFDNFRELHVSLNIERKGFEITATVEIENQKDYGMYIAFWDINRIDYPVDGAPYLMDNLIEYDTDGKPYLMNNIFYIANEKGKPAVYLGYYIKRGKPPIEQCVLLKKNEKLQIVVNNVERYYKLPQFKTLTFVYQSPLGVSNVVTISKGKTR